MMSFFLLFVLIASYVIYFANSSILLQKKIFCQCFVLVGEIYALLPFMI